MRDLQRRLSDDEDMVVMDMDDYGVVVGSSVRQPHHAPEFVHQWVLLQSNVFLAL